jgi:hypothetical protein
MEPYGISGELTALVALGVLILVMRWVFSRPRRITSRPVDASDSAELGLLTVVARALPRAEADRLSDRLRDAGIRASSSRRRDGRIDLLVFADDLARARVVLAP